MVMIQKYKCFSFIQLCMYIWMANAKMSLKACRLMLLVCRIEIKDIIVHAVDRALNGIFC